MVDGGALLRRHVGGAPRALRTGVMDAPIVAGDLLVWRESVGSGTRLAAVSRTGARAAALPDGRAFAAKVEDGAARALGPVLATVLRFWGFDGPAVRRWAPGSVPPGSSGWSGS